MNNKGLLIVVGLPVLIIVISEVLVLNLVDVKLFVPFLIVPFIISGAIIGFFFGLEFLKNNNSFGKSLFKVTES
mgnify:FL=1